MLTELFCQVSVTALLIVSISKHEHTWRHVTCFRSPSSFFFDRKSRFKFAVLQIQTADYTHRSFPEVVCDQRSLVSILCTSSALIRSAPNLANCGLLHSTEHLSCILHSVTLPRLNWVFLVFVTARKK